MTEWPSNSDDLAANAAILSIVRKMIAPYEERIEQVEADARRAAEKAERAARFLEEDNKRLARSVAEESERLAEIKAKEIVRETFKKLDIDVEEPAKFTQKMYRLMEIMNAIDSAKKITGNAVITGVIGGILYMLWNSFKGSLLKP